MDESNNISLLLGQDDIYRDLMRDNFKERRIVLNSDITDDVFEYVCLSVLKWNQEDKHIPREDRKKIYIYVNSLGGDSLMGTQILSSIVTSETPVVTVGFGNCFSMASYVLAAGHERYCFPNTVVLYHDGMAGYMTSGNKGKDIQRFYDAMDKNATKFMLEHTKMTAEFLERIKDREYYIFPEEAKELGIVDKIIGVDCTLDEIL